MRKISLSIFSVAVALGISTITFSLSDNNKPKVSAATIDINDYTACQNAYNDTSNPNQASNLLTEIRKITSPGSSGSYNALWTTYQTAYKKNNKIFDYYSNVSSAGTNQCGSYKNEGDCYNREHSIPQSWWGGGTNNQGSDPFIVVPTDGKINSMRSNYSFGMVKTITDHSENNFSKLGTSDSNNWGGSGYTVFEPDDSVKGDFARIMYYAIGKYSDSYNWTQDTNARLCFAGNTSTNFGLTNYAVKLFSYWSHLDPVDKWEQSVNNKLAGIQNNRNPFIDHPEYADVLWGSNSDYTPYSGSVTPTGSVSISKSSVSLTVDDETTISATSSDNSTITWISEDEDIVTVSSNTSSSGANVTLTAVGEGTTNVKASATIGSVTYYANCNVTVSSSGGGDTPTPVEGDSESIDLSAQGFSNTQTVTSVSGAASTITFAKGSGSNDPKYYDSGSSVRCYAGNTITIASTSRTIVKIEFTFGNSDGSNAITSSPATYDSGTWTGSSSSVTFTIGGTSGNRRIHAITITYEDEGGEEEVTISSIEVSTPPNKVSYEVGENFSPVGLQILVTYSNNDEETIRYSDHPNDFTFEPSKTDSLTLQHTQVKITYGGVYCYQAITVTSPSLTPVVTGVSVTPTSVELDLNGTTSTTLTAVVEGNNDPSQEVTWVSGDEDVATVSDLGVVSAIAVGETTIFAYSVEDDTFYGECLVNVTDSTPSGSTEGKIANSGWYKITTSDDLTNGDYLIVYEDGSTSFNGGLSTLDASNNVISTSISDGVITYSSATYAARFTIEKGTEANKYSIKSASNLYINNASDSNSLSTSSSVSYNTITFYDSVVDIMSSGGAHLRFNNASNQNRFRYFKSSTYTNQKAIQLYKYIYGYEDFSKDFLDNMTCDGVSSITAASGTWTTLSNKFNTMISPNKEYLKIVLANKDGTTYSEKAMARYDLIVSKYGTSSYPNFIARTITNSNGLSILNLISYNQNMTPMIIVISISTLTLVGYSFIRKRKQD